MAPAHFFELSWGEIDCVLKGMGERRKEEWEMARLSAWAAIQSQSSQPVEPSDVISFGWEKEKKAVDRGKNSKKRWEEAKKMAETVKKYMENGK